MLASMIASIESPRSPPKLRAGAAWIAIASALPLQSSITVVSPAPHVRVWMIRQYA